MSSAAPRPALIRLAVTLVSVLLIVASIVTMVLLLASPRKTDSAKLADQRSDVASVANAFVGALGTYDRSLLQGATMPSYRAKVEAVLTPKFAVAFVTDGAPKAEKAVALAGLKETVRIWSTGVAAISGDRATVLVVGALTQWLPKTAGGTDYKSLGETPFRTVITLVNSGGQWLVDGQAPAEGIPPTAVPTPAPSTSATPSGTASTPTAGASK